MPCSLQLGDRMQNVVGGERDVLHAGPRIEIEILFDLRFLFAFGRLVDGEFDVAVAVGHHLRHQRGVFGGDVFVVEVLIEREAHHAGVEIDPLVHLVPAHVAHHVIDVEQADGARDVVVFDARGSREETGPCSRCARQRCGWCRRRCECWRELRGRVRQQTICGSSTLTAPRLVVSCQAWRASSTQSAIARTPSPCWWMCSAIGCWLRSGVVSTKRILPCWTT